MRAEKMNYWTWECSIDGCPAHGVKPLPHYKALHNGKWHIIRSHRIRGKNPIIKKVKD